MSKGYTTYVEARRLDRMANLEKLGAILLPLDLTDDSSIGQAAERIRTAQSRINVLPNSTGYGCYGAVEDLPIHEARRRFEVNAFVLPDRFNDWMMGAISSETAAEEICRSDHSRARFAGELMKR